MNNITDSIRIAREGELVLHVSESQVAARRAFNLAVTEAGESAAEIQRANGRESITFPTGGRVDFISRETSAERGMAVDVVILPYQADHERYWPNVIASSAGRLISYGG